MSGKEAKIAVMTEVQAEYSQLEKLLEKIGKSSTERRKRSNVENFEAERAEIWERIVTHKPAKNIKKKSYCSRK